MNNEMNNNVNTSTNTGGMNFIQGGMPNNGINNGNIGQTSVNQIPQSMSQNAVSNTTPMTNNSVSQIMPQGVENQGIANTPQAVNSPVEQAPVNFVSSDVPTQSAPIPNQMPQGMTTNQNVSPMGPQPMPGIMPQQVQSPVMPMQQQPMMGGGMPPQMPIQSMPMQNGTYADDTTDNKKNKTPILMIIITILVVVGVVVFLVLYLNGKINFGANNTNNQGNGNTAEEIDNVQEDTILTDWMSYLLEQNITQIQLIRYDEDNPSNSSNVSITTEQLSNIFRNMANYNLIKYYTTNDENNTKNELRITYMGSDSSLDFWISDGRIDFDDNSDLLALFENTEYTIQDDGETSRDSDDYNFVLENFDSNLYDEYFVSANEEDNENNEE